MLKNNIFTNPIGWSDKIVGTVSRYIIAVIMTISIGAILMFVFAAFYMLVPLGLKHFYFIMTLILLSTIIFPLCYLRAARSLLIELKNYCGDNNGN